ncbi:MAG: OmpP1/FadL family transporter [Capnocytophaga gingivalis]|jgi:putative membrane protein
MKKNIIIIGFCLITPFVWGQNLTDGLRYSMEDMGGTARFKAMSGAFNSLGGDMSAIALNPAGSSIFTRSEMTLSMQGTNVKNEVGKQTTLSSDFLFNQFGVAFPITIGEEGWKNVAFAFNYQKINNFEVNDLVYNQRTNGVNLGDYFQYYANGIEQTNLMLQHYDSNKRPSFKWRLDDLYSYYGQAQRFSPYKLRNALLGYTVGLINPKNVGRKIEESMTNGQANAVLDEKEYVKNISAGTTTLRKIEQYSEGGVNKYNFNFAARYDFLSFGLNLNSHSVDYRMVTKHYEQYPDNTESSIRSAYFQNELRTVGSGFSLQLGAIAEIATGVRIGLTYTSPTWYTLQDELSQSANTNKGEAFANPNVVAVYEKYNFRTPGSWTVGASWVWNKQLILSADYMYRGFGNMRFTSDNKELQSENTIIQNTLGDTNALRLGAEYRLPMSKTNHLFLRGGGRYEQSPYKTDYKPISRLKSLSTGVGVSFSNMRFDLSYDITRRYYQPQLYEKILTDTPMVKNTTHNILLSFSLKL